jgi:hypothetical protein
MKETELKTGTIPVKLECMVRLPTGKASLATFHYVLKEAIQELQHNHVYKNITVAALYL